jgi:CheY-like chemotaxis protein
VIAELRASSAAELIERVAHWRRQNRATEIVVVAARSLASWRDIALEAGASLFVTSPRKLADVATMIHRQAARHPQPTTATADRIWAELPLAATANNQNSP